jgi:hypothetical protein
VWSIGYGFGFGQRTGGLTWVMTLLSESSAARMFRCALEKVKMEEEEEDEDETEGEK